MQSQTNTKTILNIKLDKSLKEMAQELAKDLGIPLGTAITTFLKQFVRERELTLSANTHTPTPYLQRIIKQTEKEYEKESPEPKTEDEFMNHLKNL